EIEDVDAPRRGAVDESGGQPWRREAAVTPHCHGRGLHELGEAGADGASSFFGHASRLGTAPDVVGLEDGTEVGHGRILGPRRAPSAVLLWTATVLEPGVPTADSAS